MSEPILFANPRRFYEERTEKVDAVIKRALTSGWYILGPEVEAFESEFAAWMTKENRCEGHSIGVGNGTDAIELCLRGIGIHALTAQKMSPAVFTVSHTAVATVSAIERAGGVPVLVDIEESSFTMSPHSLEAAISTTIKSRPDLIPFAVVPVHLYGHPCDMGRIMAVAERFNLLVVEDCAQAHGALWQGAKVGTMGHAAAFSFYPTKNLGALGDAGGVFTPDRKIAERIKALRQYGWVDRYISAEAGINSRLDPLQAAVLRLQLTYLDEDNARRRTIAKTYESELATASFILPTEHENVTHARHLYVIRTAKREDFIGFMKQRGIHCALHYPQAVHQQPAYASRLMIAPGGLPVTEAICRDIVSLPMYPQLTHSEQMHVCQAAVDWHKQGM